MATATAGVFSSSSKGENDKRGQKGYEVLETVTAVGVEAASDNLVSPVFKSTTDLINDQINGKKIAMGVNVVVGFDDVAATLLLEGSHDGTNFHTVDTLSSDTTPNVTGVKSYLADLTDVKVPYLRMNFNGGTAAINTTGTLKFFVAIPVE